VPSGSARRDETSHRNAVSQSLLRGAIDFDKPGHILTALSHSRCARPPFASGKINVKPAVAES